MAKQEVKVGDAVWCRGGFGFVVRRVCRDQGVTMYFGEVLGREAYATSDAARRIDPPDSG